MEYLFLFSTFFKLGLFTIGGGLAAIPLLQIEAVNNGWLTVAEFADIIAVSQSTPGPIGVNMATYVGYTLHGIPGALTATLGLVAPSIIIITLVAKFLLHFNENRMVKSALNGVRPAVTGLISVAAFTVAQTSLFPSAEQWSAGTLDVIFEMKKFILFALILTGIFTLKKHPLLYIFAGGAAGILFF